MFELLGNSACGKLIESLSRQIKVTFTKNENVGDKALLGRPSDGTKKAVVIDRPFQVGIKVHPSSGTASPAGVLLGLYRSFRGQKRLRTHGDGLGQYLGLSAETLEDAICSQLKAEFEGKKYWLA